MAARKIGDLVVTIQTRSGPVFRQVGALLEPETNDPTKGPGFLVMIDKTFNPAGVQDDKASVTLSVYHPRDRAQAPQPKSTYKAPPLPPQPDIQDDDIPF